MEGSPSPEASTHLGRGGAGTAGLGLRGLSRQLNSKTCFTNRKKWLHIMGVSLPYMAALRTKQRKRNTIPGWEQVILISVCSAIKCRGGQDGKIPSGSKDLRRFLSLCRPHLPKPRGKGQKTQQGTRLGKPLPSGVEWMVQSLSPGWRADSKWNSWDPHSGGSQAPLYSQHHLPSRTQENSTEKSQLSQGSPQNTSRFKMNHLKVSPIQHSQSHGRCQTVYRHVSI